MPDRVTIIGVAMGVAAALLLVVVFTLFPAISQPESYHNFADGRACNIGFKIPNCNDVLSNLPFLLVRHTPHLASSASFFCPFLLLYFAQFEAGIDGLFVVSSTFYTLRSFQSSTEKVPFIVLYASLPLIAFGSAYYHWNPTTMTLFWDRLPMTIAFMAALSALLNDFISPRLARVMLLPLLILGVSSVLYWRYTEYHDEGDLRLYAFVQAFPILCCLPVILFSTPRYTHSAGYLVLFAGYVFAKIFEILDGVIYLFTFHVVSGHTLKHLSAALGLLLFTRFLARRVPHPSKNSKKSA